MHRRYFIQQRRTRSIYNLPALKYTWETKHTSETSFAFLDIKVSISGNRLCISVHYKPTDSHSTLLYSSSHPSHVKNSILYSQFLRLRRLCSDDSDVSSKSEDMCQFFEKRGYPVSVVKAGHHRAKQFDRQSAPQTSQKDKNDRIPFVSEKSEPQMGFEPTTLRDLVRSSQFSPSSSTEFPSFSSSQWVQL